MLQARRLKPGTSKSTFGKEERRDVLEKLMRKRTLTLKRIETLENGDAKLELLLLN